MSDDPAIAVPRAIVASNGEAANAFLKLVEVLEPLRKDQRMWCVRQIGELVNSGFKAELPDLLPTVRSNRQITDGEVPETEE